MMNVFGYKDKTTQPIYDCAEHEHETWELIYSLDGMATDYISGKCQTSPPGSVAAIPAGTLHYKMGAGGFRDICVTAKRLNLPSTCVTVFDSDGALKQLFELIIKTLIMRERGYEDIADGILDLICLYIKRNLGNAALQPFVIKLKARICENIDNPDFDLSAAINDTGYNPDYCRCCFKEATDHTPLEYLTELRVEKAKTLLAEYRFFSIVEVSEQCGFRDSFYFSTRFKKSVGLSPAQYRKEYINGLASRQRRG